jgi:hypothetical protein
MANTESCKQGDPCGTSPLFTTAKWVVVTKGPVCVVNSPIYYKNGTISKLRPWVAWPLLLVVGTHARY